MLEVMAAVAASVLYDIFKRGLVCKDIPRQKKYRYVPVAPVLKWVGGKTQLLHEIRRFYPKRVKKYCEPFVGGGSVLLDVLRNDSPRKVLANDANPELINVYIQIKKHPEELIGRLQKLETEWHSAKTDAERKDIYKRNRDVFNYQITKEPGSLVENAALFIFLNKTCFNGLYRVNGAGEYNVPMGSIKKPKICDAEKIRAVSKLLKNVRLNCGGYEDCLPFIDRDTFVYMDPPYRPVTQTSSFNQYARGGFDDAAQAALASFVRIISSRGARVVLSNSDTKDGFFERLYRGFNIVKVSATRMLNSNGEKRGPRTDNRDYRLELLSFKKARKGESP